MIELNTVYQGQTNMQRHGGKILSDHLQALGVERVFSVPGESFLAALDGLYDSGIQNIVCRQEGGAAMMAEAYGKMTGGPGVCFVTRGPGATNASAGVHIASQDSTPMILFVGQIDNRLTDRETFQEVDYRAMFGSVAKWVAQVDHIDRIAEYVSRAFQVATSGRPGPVVLALPENMLSAISDAPNRPSLPDMKTPNLTDVATDILARISEAERPMVVVGGPHWSAKAAADLAKFAQVQSLPVALGFRRQDYLDNRHRCYAGDLNVGINPRLAARIKGADLLVVIGSRFGDIETQGYTNPDPNDAVPMIHVHADADEIGSVYPAQMGIIATAPVMVSALAALPACDVKWTRWTADARADYDNWLVPVVSPGDLKQEDVICWLSDNLPEDAILTNGAGNYAAWLHRYFVFKGYGTQLAPTSGSMGYGFPAAISASLHNRGKVVVCLAGDGCFQMTCNELSTAVQHGATPIIVVMDNGRYGTIRMHQEKTYPGRVSGTALANPDFVALAHAYGGYGALVTRSQDFADAFARARASGTFAVIACKVDGEALSIGTTLSAVRKAAGG